MNRRNFLRSVGVASAATTLTPLAGALLPAAADAAPMPLPLGGSGAQTIPPDQITNLPGVEYFFVGNGVVTCAVQLCTNPASGTALGVTFMQPNHFSRKHSTMLFHPEHGLARTVLTVITENTPHRPAHDGVSAKYTFGTDGQPGILASWNIGQTFTVEEEFVPSGRQSAVMRRVRIKNKAAENRRVKVQLQFYPNFLLFDEFESNVKDMVLEARGFLTMQLFAQQEAELTSRTITVNLGTFSPNETKEMQFMYLVADRKQDIFSTDVMSIVEDKRDVWASSTRFGTNLAAYNAMYDAARLGLRAAVSKDGKMDAGIWQYNAEWVQDASAAVIGAVHSGQFDLAKSLLGRILGTMINENGSPAESSRNVSDDMLELNQSGALLYAMWMYWVWTGDDVLKSNWSKVEKIVAYVLKSNFVDASGLLHNKREFWERTEQMGFKEGFELSHQVYVIAGLERIAEYAKLKEKETAAAWAAAAKKMRDAMTTDPKFALVSEGRFIKRKGMGGEVVTTIVPGDRSAFPKNAPLAVEDVNTIDPDSTNVLPIVYGLVDPTAEISKKTLASVEKLWNQKWTTGGYGRYDVTSEPDSPGAWPFASIFIARAYAAAGDGPKVQRVLEWLAQAQGGKGGGWFEFYGERAVPPLPPVGIVVYTWSELLALFVRDLLGFRPEADRLVVQPQLLAGISEYTATVRVRETTYEVSVKSGAPGAKFNGVSIDMQKGRLEIPIPKEDKVKLEITV